MSVAFGRGQSARDAHPAADLPSLTPCLSPFYPHPQAAEGAKQVSHLQADMGTLQHLVDELSKAVKENRSAHARRILRYVR